MSEPKKIAFGVYRHGFDLGVSVKGLLCMHVTSVPLLIEAVHIQTEHGGCDDRKEDGDMAKKRPVTTEYRYVNANLDDFTKAQMYPMRMNRESTIRVGPAGLWRRH